MFESRAPLQAVAARAAAVFPVVVAAVLPLLASTVMLVAATAIVSIVTTGAQNAPAPLFLELTLRVPQPNGKDRRGRRLTHRKRNVGTNALSSTL